MGKFSGLITGRENKIVRGRVGQAYHSPVTVEAPDRNRAKDNLKSTLLSGERLVYVGPGDKVGPTYNNHEIPPARG